MGPYKERRYGSFTLRRDFIESHTDVVLQMMATCIIVRAELQDYDSSIHYHAVSPHFAMIPARTGVAHEYRPTFHETLGFTGWERLL